MWPFLTSVQIAILISSLSLVWLTVPSYGHPFDSIAGTSTCADLPTAGKSAVGPHAGVFYSSSNDPSVAIELSEAVTGAPTANICPGMSYVLKVRPYLDSKSSGDLGVSQWEGVPSFIPSRIYHT